MNSLKSLFEYVGISIIKINDQMTEEEIDNIKKIIMSPNTITQIEFINCNIDVINEIKYYLELSPYIIDKNINKYLLFKEINHDVCQLNCLNPRTWNISYLTKRNYFKLTSIVKYKIIVETKNIIDYKIKNHNSMIDIIKEIYNFIKTFNVSEYEEIDMVITNHSGSSKGINKAFRYMLSLYNIRANIVKNDSNYVVIVYVEDDIYKVKGYYLFNPFLDKCKIIDKNYNFEYFLINSKEYEDKTKFVVRTKTGKKINKKNLFNYIDNLIDY